MITKSHMLRSACAMLVGSLCAMQTAHAQPTPARNAVPPIAAPAGGLSMAAGSVAIAGKLDIDNVISVAGETVKLHAVFSRAGTPVNGASLQFRVDGASVGQGVTSANGATDVPYKLVDSLTLGAHTLLVVFPGDSKTRETTASAKLTVLKSITSLTSVVSWGEIAGLLRGASDSAYLGNRKLVIKHEGATIGTTTTDGGGGYRFKFATQVGVPYLVEFEGETNYLGTTKTATLPLPPGVGPHIDTQFLKP